MAFLKGCLHKKAALTAMDKDPTDLDTVLQYANSAVTNQTILELGLSNIQLVCRISADLSNCAIWLNCTQYER
jgi:hypothetical protein